MGLRVWKLRVVAFLRAGYAKGAPVTGYVPLLALLPRKVSDEEAAMITSDLVRLKSRTRKPRSIDAADVGVEIIRVTGEMPSLDDIERVRHRLDATGL